MRFHGERRQALFLDVDPDADLDAMVREASEAMSSAASQGAAVAYAFVDRRLADVVFDRLGFTALGPTPLLVRPLRLRDALDGVDFVRPIRRFLPSGPLLLPFGRSRRAGVREILTKEPRVTRLWDRFSIDVGVAVERTAKYFDASFEHLGTPEAGGHRVFVFEDGDRYVIRALCMFRIAQTHGYVTELLHDRSLAGMRAASHLLGLALREMSDAGAGSAVAWSLQHSGSYPIYARHAFILRTRATDRVFGATALDPSLDDAVRHRESWYLSLLDDERPLTMT
jgi:hypothetical protein